MSRLVDRLLFGENVRLVDRILFPEMFPVDNILADVFEDADIFERRHYRVLNRRIVNHWQDNDFFERFRVTKPFFYEFLDEISPTLAQDNSRFVLFYRVSHEVTNFIFLYFSTTEVVICNQNICFC